MERRFHGKTRDEMNEVLNFISILRDELELSEEDKEKFDIVVRCVATVTNRLVDNKRIFDE